MNTRISKFIFQTGLIALAVLIGNTNSAEAKVFTAEELANRVPTPVSIGNTNSESEPIVQFVQFMPGGPFPGGPGPFPGGPGPFPGGPGPFPGGPGPFPGGPGPFPGGPGPFPPIFPPFPPLPFLF